MSFLRNREYRPTIIAGQPDTFSTRGISWCLQTDAAPQWVHSEPTACHGELVKENVKRKVLKLDGFFVKQNTYQGNRKLLKRMSRGSASREAEVCRKLEALGVAVPEVVAYGEELQGGLLLRDLLVTRAVADSINLDLFLETGYTELAARQKRELVKSFALFIKQLHEQGVLHPDLHLGNILYADDAGGGRFVLLDVDKIELKSAPLARSDELKSLAILLNSVRAWTSRQERFRFLRDYGFPFDGNLRALVEAIQTQHLSLALRVWDKKTERCLHTNSRFVTDQAGGFSVWRKREGLSDEELNLLLHDPDGLLESGQIAKAGNTVRAAIVTIGDRRFFLKRYNIKGNWYRLRNAFRRSRAARTWRNFWALHVRNLPVPQPLACLEQRHFRLLGRSYILSEYIDRARTLAEAWNTYDDERKRATLIKTGLLIAEMHRTCCLHGDLKWNNFLVSDDKIGEVFIIDLDGTRLVPRVSHELCRKDLDRFLRDLRAQEDGARWLGLIMRVWSKAAGCQ